MKHDVEQEIELRRYLLGELPFEEEVLVEQRLFLDSEYAELHQAVEDELIDEYLANELQGYERKQFETHFLLTPEHGANLKIAEALKNYLANEAKPAPEKTANNTSEDNSSSILPFSFLNKPTIWLSLTVAALILLAVVAWIVFRSTRPAAEGPLQATEQPPAPTQPDNRQQPAPVPVQNDNRPQTAERGNANESGVKPDNSNQAPERRPELSQILAVTVFPGDVSRSGGPRKMVTISADTKEIEFTLPLEFTESYEKYRAELLRGERLIDERSDLKSQRDEKLGSAVLVTFPADRFREQSYRIKLHGIPSDQQPAELPSTYSFQVERK